VWKRKVRAPPEKMPGNYRAAKGSYYICNITLTLTESATENIPPKGKGAKVV